jgi:septal ring factor EnvC (AmiA/AmiB activator)
MEWSMDSAQTWVTISTFVAMVVGLFAVVPWLLRGQSQQMRQGFAEVRRRFDQVDARFDRLETKLAVVTTEVSRLRSDVDHLTKTLDPITDELLRAGVTGRRRTPA